MQLTISHKFFPEHVCLFFKQYAQAAFNFLGPEKKAGFCFFFFSLRQISLKQFEYQAKSHNWPQSQHFQAVQNFLIKAMC